MSEVLRSGPDGMAARDARSGQTGSDGADITAPVSPRAVRAVVDEVCRRLQRMVQVRAALLSISVAAVVITLLVLMLRAQGTSWRDGVTGSLLAVLAVAIAALMQWFLMRRQPTVTPVRAALWLEERVPSAHALVTLAATAPNGISNEVEVRLARAAGGAVQAARPSVSTATRRAWRMPALAMTLALLTTGTVLRLPSVDAARGRGSSPVAARSGATSTPSGTRLAPWRVRLQPPAYARQAATELDDPAVVSALPGTRLRLIGRGSADGLTAQWIRRGDAVATATLEVRDSVGAWVTELVMPGRPAALRLTDARAGGDRTLTLVPRPDSLPVVQLLEPERDVVQRDSTGTLTLVAVARDDLGLGSVRFELIITSGSGERYSARTVVLGERSPNGRVRDSLVAATSLESLGLQGGDIVHMRAVARDLHPAADREAGVSETRSLRIARADEYDSVAVDAAPPPVVDSSLLSQRMVLQLTERLEARRPRLERAVLVAEARRLAAEQARIRRAVSGLVFQRLSGDGESEHVHYEGDGHDHGLVVQAGKLVPSASSDRAPVMPGATPPPSAIDFAGGESPIVGINRPLLEAYNHMWDAGRALELADPAAAIPPMRLALDAIQRARAAERVYLRGRTRPIVVDLDRVRLAGRDTGQASSRRAGDVLPDRERVWDARLRAAAALLPSQAAAARDSLLTLRLDALEARPDVAAALGLALEAMRGGGDVTEALVRARRTLAPPVRSASPPSWGTP